jgi:hypothetical protein
MTLEQRISAHLSWLQTLDPAYAKWARANYWDMLKGFYK